MATATVREFTDANFDQEVIKAGEPVLVDFWAPWCQPCKALAPTIDALAASYEGKAKVGKVNIDENMESAMKFGIRSIPTVLIFKGGQVQKQFVGFTDKSELARSLDGLV